MRVAALVFACGAVSLCAGYGGFGVTGSFPDFGGLDARLNELNREWGGQSGIRVSPPVLWFGGHGAGRVGWLTIGGRGAAGIRRVQADSVAAEFAGVAGFLDVGYRFEPLDYLWVRPFVDLGGTLWGHYIHSRESFTEPNFSRGFVGWALGPSPGVEVMGRLRYVEGRYVGLFVKAGWFIPVFGPEWYIHERPPDFEPLGLNVEVGVRFGTLPIRPMRI